MEALKELQRHISTVILPYFPKAGATPQFNVGKNLFDIAGKLDPVSDEFGGQLLKLDAELRNARAVGLVDDEFLKKSLTLLDQVNEEHRKGR